LSFNYYESQADHAIEALYLSGGVTGLEGLSRYLQENVQVEVRGWDPLHGLQAGPLVAKDQLTQSAHPLAVGVGLALRSV
jgi:Tfp pilus assembly PilM family ATPase